MCIRDRCVCVSAELLFMFFGIYLCYCTRAAPSNYREVRYISWAIYNETIVSTVFYICRSASFIHSLILSKHISNRVAPKTGAVVFDCAHLFSTRSILYDFWHTLPFSLLKSELQSYNPFSNTSVPNGGGVANLAPKLVAVVTSLEPWIRKRKPDRSLTIKYLPFGGKKSWKSVRCHLKKKKWMQAKHVANRAVAEFLDIPVVLF